MSTIIKKIALLTSQFIILAALYRKLAIVIRFITTNVFQNASDGEKKNDSADKAVDDASRSIACKKLRKSFLYFIHGKCGQNLGVDRVHNTWSKLFLMIKCISLPCLSSIHFLSSHSCLGAHQPALLPTVLHGLNVWHCDSKAVMAEQADVLPGKNEKINSELKTSKVAKYI